MPALTRRAIVASALREVGAGGISGETLATELGISRVAVGKHVAALRALGYDIAAEPRTGYRLLSAPDSCIPEEVAPRLRDSLWVSCDGGPSLASTNDEAKRLARGGAPEGTLVVAAEQTGGRGRFGRVWSSPPGNVYASFVLRPERAPAEAAALPLVIALGARRALRDLGVPAELKWPNDVLVAGAKLGGILLEMTAEADRIDWVVVGVGVNVSSVPAEGAARTRDHVSAGVPEVAAALLDSIAEVYREFCEQGFAPLRAEYEAALTLVGREVAVRDLLGAVVASGVACGIADGGELLVETDAGVVKVYAGEVTLRR
jgi:BirA family biotin operon repressor/biotin-[acetyl-CoA-carboxylase] ligase